MRGMARGLVGRARPRRRWTLASRMLALQLAIVLVVLVGVAAVSLAQSNARFRDTEGRRALAVAERLAVTAGVREAAASSGGLAFLSQAQSVVESGRTFSGSTKVIIATEDRKVIASTDPLPRDGAVYLQQTDAFGGRSWVGEEQGTGAALAMAPIINVDTRETDGVVAVVRNYPTVLDNLHAALPNLLTYLGIASLLGVVGSLLLARRVKRQTLGLEPREITGLVEQREALLHGIKEGLLAIDLDRRITMVNDEAAHLLGIPQTSTGRLVADVDEAGRLEGIFEGTEEVTDRVVPFHGRLVTVNRMPVFSRGRHIGWVATLRDRTQMLELQRELDLTRSTTDTLRAQAHEFSNRMHVVSGLIELGEYDDVRAYVQQIAADQTELSSSVTSHIDDPAVAALLIAKSSQATERGVDLIIEGSTRLARLDEGLAADVNTVLGNLVDNALDAAVGAADPFVAVEVVEADGVVTITVRDSGEGVGTDIGERVFARGFSTKAGPGHERGIGLALVRLVCRKRGGQVTVRNDGGAVFVATLPVRTSVGAP
ncbi:ATP-binding protein [Pedococcus aerophilus]|uniref:histidine kinase n=2 Tax=Pedococcus aerophilus TaxID=436356 RepID=A0ABN3USK8_9MICO